MYLPFLDTALSLNALAYTKNVTYLQNARAPLNDSDSLTTAIVDGQQSGDYLQNLPKLFVCSQYKTGILTHSIHEGVSACEGSGRDGGKLNLRVRCLSENCTLSLLQRSCICFKNELRVSRHSGAVLSYHVHKLCPVKSSRPHLDAGNFTAPLVL